MNLGDSCVEIDVPSYEIIDPKDIEKVSRDFDYVVVKVDPFNYSCNNALGSLGFIFFETQIGLSKEYKDFDFSNQFIKMISRKLDFDEIESEEGLKHVLELITDDMFSTDRIYLDPYYGREKGVIRYKNWIRSVCEKKNSHLYIIRVGSTEIGFGLSIENNTGVWDYLLGGIFKKYQNVGYGLLTSASPFLFANNKEYHLSKVITDISSNNMPVVKFYNILNYSIDRFRYVFVKHNSR